MPNSMNKEQRGKRDLNISSRNRIFGVPCYDLDMIYYNQNDDPFLMTTWKHGNAKEYHTDSKENIRLVKLANRASLPLILVFYYFSDQHKYIVNDDQNYSNITHAQYRVFPLNSHARKHIQQLMLLTENKFVQMIHDIGDLGIVKNKNLSDNKIEISSNGYLIYPPMIY